MTINTRTYAANDVLTAAQMNADVRDNWNTIVAKSYLLTASDTDLASSVAIPGLAGSADRKNAFGGGATTGTTNQEFDSSSDPFTWSSTTNLTKDFHTTVKSRLYATVSTGATVYYGYQSFSPAGDFDARCGGFSLGVDGLANYEVSAGFAVLDSGSANGVLTVLRSNPSTYNTTSSQVISAYSMAASVLTERAGFQSYGADITGRDWYFRIKRTGTTIDWYLSANGVNWQKMASTTVSFTAANIGIRLGAATSNTNSYSATMDWIRANV
jgi:hypothetical protein